MGSPVRSSVGARCACSPAGPDSQYAARMRPIDASTVASARYVAAGVIPRWSSTIKMERPTQVARIGTAKDTARGNGRSMPVDAVGRQRDDRGCKDGHTVDECAVPVAVVSDLEADKRSRRTRTAPTPGLATTDRAVGATGKLHTLQGWRLPTRRPESDSGESVAIAATLSPKSDNVAGSTNAAATDAVPRPTRRSVQPYGQREMMDP